MKESDSMSIMKILIVDDEKFARAYTKEIVMEYLPDSILYEAKSAEKAGQILEHMDIDILLLDINMPELTGFELLESLSKRNFELIFVTAYNHFALNAIKSGALDYILKPINKLELNESLKKAVERRAEHWERSLSGNSPGEKQNLNTKLFLSHQQGIKFIPLKDILYLKADNVYTFLYLVDNTKIVSSKPINRFETSLDSRMFFRIHKSYIINVFHLNEYLSKDGNIACMSNGHQLPISRYRLNVFLEFMSNFSGKVRL